MRILGGCPAPSPPGPSLLLANRSCPPSPGPGFRSLNRGAVNSFSQTSLLCDLGVGTRNLAENSGVAVPSLRGDKKCGDVELEIEKERKTVLGAFVLALSQPGSLLTSILPSRDPLAAQL